MTVQDVGIAIAAAASTLSAIISVALFAERRRVVSTLQGSLGASPPTRREALQEYKDISQNLRHNGVRRDARLTLYFAIAGGLLFLLLAKDQTVATDQLKTALKVGAAIVTFLFLLIELRLWIARASYLDRARELEGVLQFRQYVGLHLWLERTPFSLLLYGLFFVFWIWIVSGGADPR